MPLCTWYKDCINIITIPFSLACLGSNKRAIEKARTLDVDCILLDLEDATAPTAKNSARVTVADALQSDFGSRQVVVRVNSLTTEWGFADVEMVANSSNAAAVLLPKVNRPSEVHALETALGPSGSHLSIWCMIETPAGVLHALDIAQSSERISALVAGVVDLGNELHAVYRKDRLPLISSLSSIVLSARAASSPSRSLAAIDGVFLSLDDPQGFREECQQVSSLVLCNRALCRPVSLPPLAALQRGGTWVSTGSASSTRPL